jgi:hydroxyacylglutathione hydrolase
MPLELITVPCLEDNYAFLLHNADTGNTLLVDIPEAAPILAVLEAQSWTLTDILITHHHWDHVGGLPDLLAALPNRPRILGGADDAHRLPELDVELTDGTPVSICGEDAQVFDVSGHTINHIAVYFPVSGVAFTADSLMALGCGRLSEGTPAMAWASLLKLRALPDDTRICSGHEYTQTNCAFALTIEPDNIQLISRVGDTKTARAAGRPTVPSDLGVEKQTNPFLRADVPALKNAVGLQDADPVDVFAHVRKKRDVF